MGWGYEDSQALARGSELTTDQYGAIRPDRELIRRNRELETENTQQWAELARLRLQVDGTLPQAHELSSLKRRIADLERALVDRGRSLEAIGDALGLALGAPQHERIRDGAIQAINRLSQDVRRLTEDLDMLRARPSRNVFGSPLPIQPREGDWDALGCVQGVIGAYLITITPRKEH